MALRGADGRTQTAYAGTTNWQIFRDGDGRWERVIQYDDTMIAGEPQRFYRLAHEIDFEFKEKSSGNDPFTPLGSSIFLNALPISFSRLIGRPSQTGGLPGDGDK